MRNDRHDSSIDYDGGCTEYWLGSLLNKTTPTTTARSLSPASTRGRRTPTLTPSKPFSLVVALKNLKITTDTTVSTHTLHHPPHRAGQLGIGSLGRQNTDPNVSNLIKFVAESTGYTNLNLTVADLPVLNIFH
ncbi:uncharacterized protein EV422DRAFT_150613 [Fimicolochytrium jonesii]|uniref:uncharacterized protein n=1 Tax=Fimicolochytrium jonesii TaxID=1396493 RepID=UPI0022FE3CE5|nr:uncharacterized protein EV422DRAFT_150613 [Fimicolochytrium jonesii]KAI8826037.1 hypothetical protein EV422DRAFT_150613 [Fimicolochytrium jonesii]